MQQPMKVVLIDKGSIEVVYNEEEVDFFNVIFSKRGELFSDINLVLTREYAHKLLGVLKLSLES